jgi:hypothetical protein
MTLIFSKLRILAQSETPTEIINQCIAGIVR